MDEQPSYKKPEGKTGEKLLDIMDQDHTPIALWSYTNMDVNEDDVLLDIAVEADSTLKDCFKNHPRPKATE